ncbi:MAG: hypothetical protein ABIY55_26620 [Kofleriaceae bacterium]
MFAGGGVGEVRVNDASGSTLATCTASCTVPALPGQVLEVAASTPSSFGGLSGACTTNDVACNVTIAAGEARVTATFTRTTGELWTRLPDGGPIRSAAFDGAGRLIVASSAGVVKLSSGGGVVWENPLAVCSIATGPHNTIYAQTATSVVKLSASGATLWAQPLDPQAIGCGGDVAFDGFVHNVAVASDGAVAIHGDSGVARWDSDGQLTWSAPVESHGVFGVAIDPHGVVHVAVESFLGETVDLVRFAADGSPLDPIESVVGQPHGMIAIDPVGRLLATGSGHSHTDGFGHSVDLPGDPDFAPNGICAASSDVGWLHEADDNAFFARDWTFDRFHADGSTASSVTRVIHGDQFDEVGTIPHDIAGALDGRIAIVGEYNGVTYHGGWIVTYGP